MWSSIYSEAAEAAEVAGEEAMGIIFRDRDIHVASPSASGRIAMAVYHAAFNSTLDAASASYFAEWWATGGGELEAVPDGTPSNH